MKQLLIVCITDVSLSSYTEANHWVVLAFFPKAWSFVCPTEIKAFSTRLEEFLYSRSCAVLFASTDSDASLKAWNATSDTEGGLGNVHVPLISDATHAVSRDYGVLIEEVGVAQRALFIIDPKGIIRSITINDADVVRSVDETQRVLDALIFKDEFGEGCPADWHKGDKGIDTTAERKPSTSSASPASSELPNAKRNTWSEWARPKLTRAWSGTSQRSIGSIVNGNSIARLRAESCERMEGFLRSNSGHHSALSSGQQSPMVSPMSAVNGNGRPSRMETQLDEAMMMQRMENLQAAMQNQQLAEKAGQEGVQQG